MYNLLELRFTQILSQVWLAANIIRFPVIYKLSFILLLLHKLDHC